MCAIDSRRASAGIHNLNRYTASSSKLRSPRPRVSPQPPGHLRRGRRRRLRHRSRRFVDIVGESFNRISVRTSTWEFSFVLDICMYSSLFRDHCSALRCTCYFGFVEVIAGDGERRVQLGQSQTRVGWNIKKGKRTENSCVLWCLLIYARMYWQPATRAILAYSNLYLCVFMFNIRKCLRNSEQNNVYPIRGFSYQIYKRYTVFFILCFISKHRL